MSRQSGGGALVLLVVGVLCLFGAVVLRVTHSAADHDIDPYIEPSRYDTAMSKPRLSSLITITITIITFTLT